ncbi:sigma 54-interacting transcriptional regulator [Haliangium sp.]|uniref:sigma 54-interacting transcriptional regulator n=1 Tax=Haliangium sp. TaxID=2663208 RepID=UPI003D105842
MDESSGRTLGATATPTDERQAPCSVPYLCLVLEAERPRAPSSGHLLTDVHEVRVGRGSARRVERSGGVLTISVPDRWMSAQHARISASFGRWILEDTGSRNGCFVAGARVGRHELRDGDVLELGRSFFYFRAQVEADGVPLDRTPEGTPAPTPGMQTLHIGLARDLARVSQLADAPVSVLILGESGTGKELVARALHTLSGRTGEFVGVNCGAIPDTLVESELFGHVKGAFSGAVGDRPGLVRAADHGTLFLDELGDLPASSQAALLRVLQEREVRPVGGTRAVGVDIRLVSATHRDLAELVAAERFRQDLFARVAGFRVRLPPLRERREDLGLLISALLARVAAEPERVSFDPAAARALLAYRWPLNIRELENCLLAATALADHGRIELTHLPEELRAGADPHAAGRRTHTGAEADDDTPSPPAPELDEAQLGHRDELVALLREHAGNVSAVARASGKHRKQIQRWIKRYGLEPKHYRG